MPNLLDFEARLWHPAIMKHTSRLRRRARISLRVFLRITAMDVCCGPPFSHS